MSTRICRLPTLRPRRRRRRGRRGFGGMQHLQHFYLWPGAFGDAFRKSAVIHQINHVGFSAQKYPKSENL